MLEMENQLQAHNQQSAMKNRRQQPQRGRQPEVRHETRSVLKIDRLAQPLFFFLLPWSLKHVDYPSTDGWVLITPMNHERALGSPPLH